jgi:hypothetical protein
MAKDMQRSAYMRPGQKCGCLCLDLNSASHVYPVKADVSEAEFMTISLRFLGVIFRVLGLKVSVWIS